MAPSAEPLLRCHDVSASYGAKTVLFDISLEVRSHSITALLGPNGSGKSTLLKTLCGSISHWSGSIDLHGSDLRALNPREVAQRVAFVPQEELPVFDFSCLQIVLMGRIPHSRGLFETKEDYDRARWAMRKSDCSQFEDRYITELSGGERQRVLIARALAQEARILLLDEPLAHLDPAHQLSIAQLLRSLATEGFGVVLATHDLNWATELANHCLLLQEGSLLLDAPMDQAAQSEQLDQIFETRFSRLRDATGRLRIFPDQPVIFER